MVFLNPLFLYGLAASSVPVILHFISGKKAKPHKFSAVKYVILSRERVARRYKLKQWLLLALRAAAIAVLALALAHPVLIAEEGLFTFQGPPQAKVIIIDNSMSMGYRDKDGERLSKAKTVAAKFITSMRPEDKAAIIAAFEPETKADAGQKLHQLTSEKERLRAITDSVGPSYGRADFKKAFATAYKVLAASPSNRKEIVVISDLYEPGWERFSPSLAAEADPGISVRILKLRGAEGARNLAVKGVSLKGAYIAQEIPFEVEALVANYSDQEAKDLLIEIHLDGVKADQKLLSIPPNSEARANFEVSVAKTGHHSGLVRIARDNLEADNEYHFSFDAHEKIKILAVDGDPKSSLVYSETYYLAAALSPAGIGAKSPMTVTTALEHELSDLDLKGFRAIFLCNLKSLPPDFRTKLIDFAAKGGGIAIFPGDKVSAEIFNEELFESTTRISPAPLLAADRTDPGKPRSITKLEVDHQIFKPFANGQSSLHRANFLTIFRTSTTNPAAETKVIATLSDGNPLIVEGSVGQGIVMLFTSTCDRDWNDLPSKTAYLPLVQNMAFYIAGARGTGLDDAIEVGDQKELRGGAELVGKSIALVKPDGTTSASTMEASGRGSLAIFKENSQPGIYQENLDGSKSYYFANPPADESSLRPVNEEHFKEIFSGRHFLIIDITNEWAWPTARPEAQDLILTYLFVALFGLVAAEIIVAGRF